MGFKDWIGKKTAHDVRQGIKTTTQHNAPDQVKKDTEAARKRAEEIAKKKK